MDDGIPRILPAHILVADRRARLVLLETVAVAITIFVNPGEAPFCSLEMTLQEPLVADGAPGGMQGNHIERCRVRSAVIGRVRDQLEMGKLAIAYFVQYLAGLGIAVVVLVLRLQ